MSSEDEGQVQQHTPESEPEWWDQPGMPWNEKPTKADYWCLGWFGFIGIFGLALIPFRAWLLGLDPPIMLALTGSRIGAASTGALASVGEAQHWLLYLLIGSIVAIKFDWVYWWAGKLWGRGILDVQAQNSKRAAKNIARVERWGMKLGWLGIFLAYVPIPSLGYVALGWWIGEPVVYVLEQYARVANWIAIGLLVVIFVGAMRRKGK